MTKKTELKEQQKRFCDYYVELGVGTKAAIKAGYSPKTARSRASKLLDDPRVQEYLKDRMASKTADVVASQDEILSFLTNVMRGGVLEEVPLLAGEGFQELAMLTTTPVSYRVKAAEIIGKRYAMWTDNQKLEGDVEIKVTVDYGD